MKKYPTILVSYSSVFNNTPNSLGRIWVWKKYDNSVDFSRIDVVYILLTCLLAGLYSKTMSLQRHSLQYIHIVCTRAHQFLNNDRVPFNRPAIHRLHNRYASWTAYEHNIKMLIWRSRCGSLTCSLFLAIAKPHICYRFWTLFVF